MEIYRICYSLYAKDISGLGAEKRGGRWNSVGYPALYCSESRALSALEVLVNLDKFETKLPFSVVVLSIPDTETIVDVDADKLIQNWNSPLNRTLTVSKGTEWLINKSSLLLKVPSAVISEESNFMINPQHPNFKNVTLKSISPFEFDTRLHS